MIKLLISYYPDQVILHLKSPSLLRHLYFVFIHMKPCLFAILLLLCLYACDQPVNHVDHKPGLNKSQAQQIVKLIPVRGYRFKVTGDFDGDGRPDTLTEHFINSNDHRETNKFYEHGDYDTLVSLNRLKKPISLLLCSNKHIPDLIADRSGRSLGLSYIKNEGDLDGDGADEISFVVDWADWSNVNHCDIMTLKNHQWKLLYTFQIRDWQMPDLPEAYNAYGPMGLENKVINSTDTSANRKIEKNLNDFTGLIKKVANYKIQIIYSTDIAEIDTMVVDIRKHHHKKG